MHNDRFKFRIWNKVLHKYQNYIILTMDDEVCAPGSSDDRFVIEQCTGLKDKNGKLIFENDNVSTRTISGKRGTVVWTADSSFRIHCSDGDFLNVKMTDTIIGNIHEVKNEQCTGISDKHGKMIYEGDRVKTVIEAVGTVQWNERMARFEVRFRTFRCEVCNTQEIVGNIHDSTEKNDVR